MNLMNEPLTEEEILLNNFFGVLNNLKNQKRLKTIKELFVYKDEKTIPILDFRGKLLTMGFDEKSDMVARIIKKYTPLFDKSVISIENMYIEYQIFEEKHQHMKEIHEKQKRMLEIKQMNAHKNMGHNGPVPNNNLNNHLIPNNTQIHNINQNNISSNNLIQNNISNNHIENHNTHNNAHNNMQMNLLSNNHSNVNLGNNNFPNSNIINNNLNSNNINNHIIPQQNLINQPPIIIKSNDIHTNNPMNSNNINQLNQLNNNNVVNMNTPFNNNQQILNNPILAIPNQLNTNIPNNPIMTQMANPITVINPNNTMNLMNNNNLNNNLQFNVNNQIQQIPQNPLASNIQIIGSPQNSLSLNNFQNDTNRPPTFGKPSNASINEFNINQFNNIPSTGQIITNANFNNNMNSFNNKEILEKLEQLDKKLMEELRSNHNFIKTKTYENFYTYFKTNAKEFEKLAKKYDKDKIGYLDDDVFYSLFDEILVLSENEKKIILMDLERNQYGKYSYIDLIHKIKHFKTEDTINQVITFNHFYNDYIVKFRNFFKINSIDLSEKWKISFREKPKIDFEDFKILLNNLNYPPLYEPECEYLFNKLSEENTLTFKKLNSIIKMNPPSRDNLNNKLDESINKSSSKDNSFSDEKNDYKHKSHSKGSKKKFKLENTIYFNNTENPDDDYYWKNKKNKYDYDYDSDSDINFKSRKNKSTNNFNKHNYNHDNDHFQRYNNDYFSHNNPYVSAARKRSSVRHEHYFKEIRSLTAEESKRVIYQRLSEVDNRIRFEVESLETFKLFQIYKYLKEIFYKMGNQHLYFFNIRDLRQNGFLTEIDFNVAFTEMRIELSKEQREIMIKSIKNKTGTHYCYMEFLQNVYNFNMIEFEKLSRYCHQNYNDYIVELRIFLRDNNINPREIWENILGKQEAIDIKMFINFLDNFDFNFSHEEEYKYLFNMMASQQGYLEKNNFIDLITMDPPPIDKFKESFQIRGNEAKVNTWKFKISNYTEQTAKLNSKNYMHLQNFFKEIHDNSIKKGVSDLISYFSDIEVNADGECSETDFVNHISKYAIKNNNFIMILNTFKNFKNNQLINLVKFFNAYYSFYYNERENNSNHEAIKKDHNYGGNSSDRYNNTRDLMSPRDNNFNKNETKSMFKTEFAKPLKNVPNLDLDRVYKNYDKLSKTSHDKKDIKDHREFINEHNQKNFINLADIQPNRNITNDDYLDVKDSINYIIEIIINEKEMNVRDYFYSQDIKNHGYFTLVEFNKIIQNDLKIATEEEEKEILEIIYSYLVDEHKPSIIKIDRLIYVFREMADNNEVFEKFSKNHPHHTNHNINHTHNSNFPFTNNNHNKNNYNQNIHSNKFHDSKLDPPNFILKEFAKYLINNRIKFTSIFPMINEINHEKSQLVTIYDFQNCFRLAKYPISPDDINLLTKYFDPYNKNTISYETIKSHINKFEPTYFTMPFQLVNQAEIKKNYSLVSKINQNPKLVEIINLLNAYIQTNKLTLDEFTLKISKTGLIKRMEFVQAILDTVGKKLKDLNNLIRDAGLLYDLLDKNKDEKLEKNELIFYLNNAQLTLEERSKKMSVSGKMLDELHQLFDMFDIDKDDKISKEDFYKALKSLNHNTTLKDVEVLMRQMDSDGNNVIDRKEFIFIMEEKIQHQMVLAQEEKDYVIKMFKEEDIDKVGFLTIQQLKHLLNEKLKCNLSEEEFMELINKADCNFDGLIDIEEFVNLLEMTPENPLMEKNENNDNFMSKTLRQINSKRRINPMQFLSIFQGLPMNFIPSFIKEEQKLFKLLPSATLKPATDESGILYKDILPELSIPKSPSKSPTNNTAHNTGSNFNHNNNINSAGLQTTSSKNSVFNMGNSGNARLRPIQTQINTKISLDKATGVSIPDEKMLDRQKNIVGRILKISFFDEIKNCFFGNSIQIEASWKKEYEDRWYFDEDRKSFNNNIIVRYNDDQEKKKINVIFEFVIIMIKEGISTETSCGWCSCDIKNLYKPSEMKLQIYGGTPLKQEMINRTDVRTKRSGWAKFTQIFSGQIKSELPIKIKPFKELSNPDKVNKYYLNLS